MSEVLNVIGSIIRPSNIFNIKKTTKNLNHNFNEDIIIV
jgi:hypothetical protein